MNVLILLYLKIKLLVIIYTKNLMGGEIDQNLKERKEEENKNTSRKNYPCIPHHYISWKVTVPVPSGDKETYVHISLPCLGSSDVLRREIHHLQNQERG